MPSSTSQRRLSFVDNLIINAEKALKTLVPGASSPQRASPASLISDNSGVTDRAHTAGLMRINHTGEVCAQALYQGQALTAKDPKVRATMAASAAEEVDHLAWCEHRLKELDSFTSHLNPLFYGGSFLIGAVAGAISDEISLGFVAATEDQVCKHLSSHLEQLPQSDKKSHAILDQMLSDEARHASHAIAIGGVEFPPLAKSVMTGISQFMTRTTYYV